MNDASDEELMDRVQNGDRDAFSTLFARWRTPIWGYLVRRSNDPEGSAELFQDVFLRVWRSAHTWQSDQRFRPWVFRVATNVLRDHLRASRREVDVVEIDPERAPTTGALESVASVDLERAMGRLPDTLREAFLLGAVHGLDHNEVAAALDITPANARARISRARATLRELLLGAA